jgi:hypothetical protein
MKNFIEPVTLHVGSRVDVESVSPGRAAIILARMYARNDLSRCSGLRYTVIERLIEAAIEARLRFNPEDFDDITHNNLEKFHRTACQSRNATASTAVRHALKRPVFYLGGKGIANEINLGCQFKWDGKHYKCTSFKQNETLGNYIVAVPVERAEGDPRIIRITHKKFKEAERERRRTGTSRGHVRR